MLADYPGTILLVSHDRDFLDRVAGSVLVRRAEADGSNMPAAIPIWCASAASGGQPSSQGARAKKPREKAERARPEAKRRLSFKEKHALETLPATMEKLRATAAKLHAILDDHALYERDPKRFNDASALLAKTEAEIAAAEDQWLELEILREEIG